MYENAIHIGQLIVRYIKDELTDEEAKMLADLARRDENIQRIIDEYKDTVNVQKRLTQLSTLDTVNAWKNVTRNVRTRKTSFAYLKYAAGILLLITTAVWLLVFRTSLRSPVNITTPPANDAPPGENLATLTLANGKKIALGNGSVEVQEVNGSTVYGKKGELDYFSFDKQRAKHTSAPMNVLVVPRAGKYRLILPDSSVVWLNSQSKIEFPASFSTTERRVVLYGEAYFDIIKDPERPFKISVGDQEIRVLGTAFNISAYESSHVQTVVVNGSVSVKAGGHTAVVEAGFAATSHLSEISVHTANIEKALAWKNGYFFFSEDSLSEIMEQLARWYDVEVTYDVPLPPDRFGGSISRDMKLSQVLEMLEEISGLSYEFNGRKLTVKQSNH
ncbi:iron dicitrate transporter FecR [Parapedobacter defluvii]|uniref:Iron dicitrate transporter FecR n=1 Tax=Parapedobacter defluvii TaxID=2045106 RepID=A0ABQ1MZW8_9SPHI|nr:FecR family protein [Parapedobacter defluvii]GGC50052.1 iron dicitrate transporter FecR [Parapedobacter defluvii]